jgi:hypothetical protein
MREITGDGKVWVPRNTIVRSVFNEVLDHTFGISLAALAGEAESRYTPCTLAGPPSMLLVEHARHGDGQGSDRPVCSTQQQPESQRNIGVPEPDTASSLHNRPDARKERSQRVFRIPV